MSNSRNWLKEEEHEEDKMEENRNKDIAMWEVQEALRKMKNGKAPGVDEVTTEMIKAAGPVGLHWMYRLFRMIWKGKEVPEDWRKGLIIPVFKKGDKKKCNNYRGIILISHVAKIFERILEKKVKMKVEEEMEEE